MLADFSGHKKSRHYYAGYWNDFVLSQASTSATVARYQNCLAGQRDIRVWLKLSNLTLKPSSKSESLSFVSFKCSFDVSEVESQTSDQSKRLGLLDRPWTGERVHGKYVFFDMGYFREAAPSISRISDR